MTKSTRYCRAAGHAPAWRWTGQPEAEWPEWVRKLEPTPLKAGGLHVVGGIGPDNLGGTWQVNVPPGGWLIEGPEIHHVIAADTACHALPHAAFKGLFLEVEDHPEARGAAADGSAWTHRTRPVTEPDDPPKEVPEWVHEESRRRREGMEDVAPGVDMRRHAEGDG